MHEKLTNMIINALPTLLGSGTGIILLTLKTIQDQLLNSMFSVVTALIIVILSYFTTRYLKHKYPNK